MDIIRVEYRRLHSFGNYENEEFGAVAEVGAGETPEAALAGLRTFVEGRMLAAMSARWEVDEVESRLIESRDELRGLHARLTTARERWEKVKVFLGKHGVTVEDLEDIPF
jgi:hypothetical protein